MDKQQHRLVIAGDIFPSKKNMNEFVSGDLDSLIDEKIRRLFSEADFSVCNLEGALTNRGIPIDKVDPVIFADTQAVTVLKKLGVSCVTLANNHIMDCGKEGFIETCETLDANGISYFGAGKNEESISKYIEIVIGGRKIVIYTVAETMFNIPSGDTPGVNLYDEYRVCNELRELKSKSDYLIVIYHGGAEFFWYGTEELRKRFHRMADAGADLITAQHTHCIGITERYENSYLLYGQGDFLFARSANVYKETGVLLEVIFSDDDVVINHHLLRHVDNVVVYDSAQDFSSFNDRNRMYQAGERFAKEYEDYCGDQIIKFLEAFRGKNLIDKVIKKLLPREKYKRYLRNRFTKRQILRIISGIQFEEFNEVLCTGLWRLASDMNE